MWALDLITNATVEQYIITCLAASIAYLFRKLVVLTGKYHQLDKIMLLVCDRSHRDIVKIHRSGDYEISHPLNKSE